MGIKMSKKTSIIQGSHEPKCTVPMDVSSENVGFNSTLPVKDTLKNANEPKPSLIKDLNIIRPIENLQQRPWTIANDTNNIKGEYSGSLPSNTVVYKNNSGTSTKDELKRIRERNLNIRPLIFKEV